MKKYFWLKLKNDFFKKREIKKLRRIAGGEIFTIIYLKMMLVSLESGGYIFYEKTEKNIFEQLSLELDEDEENIQLCIAFLNNNNLLTIEGENILMLEVKALTGKETTSAERVRKHRALQCNTNVTKCNKSVTTEIELEKEIELEIDKELEKEIINVGQMSDKCPRITEKNKSLSDSTESHASDLKEILKKYYKSNLSSRFNAVTAEKKIKTAIKKGATIEMIKTGYDNYLNSLRGNDIKFVKHFDSFMNQELWREYQVLDEVTQESDKDFWNNI